MITEEMTTNVNNGLMMGSIWGRTGRSGWFRLTRTGWGLLWEPPEKAGLFLVRWYEGVLLEFRGWRVIRLRAGEPKSGVEKMTTTSLKGINIDSAFIQVSTYGRWGWFRITRNGRGLKWKPPEEKALFSERNGYQKVILRFRGWRLFYMPPC